MPLITVDVNFASTPDAVWLRKVLPNGHVVSRSNNREVQARMCACGAGVAVLPRPIGDALSGVRRIDLGEEPPKRDTYVGYHRDLKKLARLRTLLDLVIERPSNQQKPCLWNLLRRSVVGPDARLFRRAAGLHQIENRFEPSDHVAGF